MTISTVVENKFTKLGAIMASLSFQSSEVTTLVLKYIAASNNIQITFEIKCKIISMILYKSKENLKTSKRISYSFEKSMLFITIK